MVVIGAQVVELLLIFDKGLNMAGVLFYDYALLLGAWLGSYKDLGRVVGAASDCATVRLLISCWWVVAVMLRVLAKLSV